MTDKEIKRKIQFKKYRCKKNKIEFTLNFNDIKELLKEKGYTEWNKNIKLMRKYKNAGYTKENSEFLTAKDARKKYILSLLTGTYAAIDKHVENTNKRHNGELPRLTCFDGEKAHKSKLKNKEALAIFLSNDNLKTLKSDYKVSYHIIYNILTNKTYFHSILEELNKIMIFPNMYDFMIDKEISDNEFIFRKETKI
jgi:hypothetical protein